MASANRLRIGLDKSRNVGMLLKEVQELEITVKALVSHFSQKREGYDDEKENSRKPYVDLFAPLLDRW